MAAAVSRDPGTALRVHTREELGVDPAELPSPVVAGAASLVAFSLGALIPLLPYLFGLHVLLAAAGYHGGRPARRGMTVGRPPAVRCCGPGCASWPSAAWRSGSPTSWAA